MSLQDKALQCADCGTTFTFSGEEQELFKARGYTNEPRRCPSCRKARKSGREGDATFTRRQMFPARCTECGKDTEVPFEPRRGKPVYCSDCYSKVKRSR